MLHGTYEYEIFVSIQHKLNNNTDDSKITSYNFKIENNLWTILININQKY